MSTEGFLSRWSRQKVEARDAPLPQTEVLLEAEENTLNITVMPDTIEPALSQTEQDELVDALPHIDELTDQSDFSAFLKKGVPEELKNLALRKLWRSNPIFANLDGLNDYDEDFTQITPLAAGLADELIKLMKENSRNSKISEDELEEDIIEEEDETELTEQDTEVRIDKTEDAL
jgi:hypothetical protein